MSVRWVIVPVPAHSDRVEEVRRSASAVVYRLPGALPRARVVTRARIAASMDEVRRLTLAGEIDLRRELLLHDVRDSPVLESLPLADGASSPTGTARIVVDRATEVVVEADAPQGGLLILADAFCPGWVAAVDGRETQILRVNVMQRAVSVSPGTHRVVFTLRAGTAKLGMALTGAGVMILVGIAASLRFRG
jgi:hypothetical protein